MSENLAYHEEFREELIGGEFVMMAPASTNHTFTAGNIFGIFWSYLKRKKCTPISDGSTVFLTEEDHFVPDVMVVCNPEIIRPDGVREYWIVSPGDKSVEVYRSAGTEFTLDNVYVLCPDWELERMSPERRAAVETHFKCSLFDDLDISLEEIFYRTF